MRARLLAVLLALPCAASAQLIDFAAVFDERAAEVVPGGQIGDSRVDLLSMPEGVELRRLTGPDGAVSYIGIDVSGAGAVGCLYQIYFELVAAATVCPWTPPRDEARVLQDRLRRIARFVMANGVPPLDPDGVDQYLEDALGRWKQSIGTQACVEPDPGLQGFAGALASEALAPELDAVLAVPRLPVTNPCL